jgi:transposase
MYMGRPSKKLELTSEQEKGLKRGYEAGKGHAYRKRCQMMLLKSEARSSEDIAKIVDSCEMSVNGWINRYEAEGIQGLQTKPGRGRKAILDATTDDAKIKEVVQANRQRLSVAKAELEEALEKQFSQKTLERYIKNVLVVINASENVLARSPVTRRMPINGKR